MLAGCQTISDVTDDSYHFSCLQPVLLSRLFCRSRDRDRDLGLQVSRPRPRPWTSGLKTKTKTLDFRSGDRDRGLGLQVSRPRPSWTKWTRVHSSLETMVSRSQHCLQHALCLLSAWNRFLLTVAFGSRLQYVQCANFCSTTGCKITPCHSEVNTNGLRLIRPRRDV